LYAVFADWFAENGQNRSDQTANGIQKTHFCKNAEIKHSVFNNSVIVYLEIVQMFEQHPPYPSPFETLWGHWQNIDTNSFSK